MIGRRGPDEVTSIVSISYESVGKQARPGSGDEILFEGCARYHRPSLTHYSARTERIVKMKTVLDNGKHKLSRGVFQVVSC